MGGFLQIAANAQILKHGFTPITLLIYNPQHVMNVKTYRYYYYYGPLSAGRDGQAMVCRRALTM